ncbi:MAG: nickel pincer cofactor biosynthesis protein LarC [Eubacteriales bacterium]|nr:nickel pincer cofactor biosynthesis protein LarC [Eubacteriales bacterium]
MNGKILYFDCASGISGDMTLGALLDLGADEKRFLEELQKLHVDGYHITVEETQKNGIRAKHVKVHVNGEAQEDGPGHEHHHGQENDLSHGHHHGQENDPCHEHHHGQEDGPGCGHHHEHDDGMSHRTFGDIRKIIGESDLDGNVKELSLRIFERVAKAEAKVHGKSVEEVHFHEVGAVDSIVDIVGCAVLINMIQPEKIYASPVCEGHGYVNCQHGTLSVPVPATSEILAAAEVPMRQIDVEGELVTPTGAAIIAELAQEFGTMPQMKLSGIGWGAGTKNLVIPNVLKVYEGTAWSGETVCSGKEDKSLGGVMYGETGKSPDSVMRGETGKNPGSVMHDEIEVLEANIDDCTGEMLGCAMEKLLEAGALDVCCTPVFMKKNRPAYRLTVLAKPEDGSRMETLIFQHTTTIGIRKRRESRSILERERVWVATPYGKLEAKQVFLENESRIYPEYESAVKAAKENHTSLWEIYRSYGRA